MIFKSMTKRLRRHDSLLNGEEVIHACYGLGKSVVLLANRVVFFANRAITLHHDQTWTVPETAQSGLATPIQRSGVLALTNRRLLFFQRRFAIGTPRHVTADWPLVQLHSIRLDDDNLTVCFVDGSKAALHVPQLQQAKQMVKAFLDQCDRPPTSP